MSVRLHIDRLVVEPGFGATSGDGPILRDAIEAELGRLLADQGTGWAAISSPRRIAQVEQSDAPGPGALGTQIAGALSRCLREPSADSKAGHQ